MLVIRRVKVAMLNHSGQGRGQAGVTLIELMIAMVILSVIVAFGVPSFREATANAALRGTTMDLVAALNTARAESVNLRVPVTFAPTDAADWSQGWDITYPAEQDTEDRSFVVRPGVTVEEEGGLLTLEFRANGTVNNEAVFIICDGRPNETGRRIEINRLGRMTNQEFNCQ
jgi:type IV fimbrial biogenesis protein FimT